VSLLWPDKVVCGLFPGQCWLKRAGVEVALAGGESPDAMLAALGALLDGQAGKLRKGTKISLMVSDSLGALVALPWHDQLTSPDEVNGYAVACFEKQGIDIGDGWVMHAQFRAPGSMGLAYALPRVWLVSLVALLNARGLQLERVLPVSALAYWRVAKMVGDGQELVLLREAQRTSVLVYDRTGLLGLDVEPVTGNVEESGRRLLRRVAAYYPQMASVLDWSAATEEGMQPAYIAACFPDVANVAVGRDDWS
jgi:hypothetical protein